MLTKCNRNGAGERRMYRRKRAEREWISWLKVPGLLLLLALALWFEQRDRPREAEGRARIIDGDSLVVDGLEVRLKSIDAPEARQTCRRGNAEWRCGEEAARQLQRLAGNGRIACRGRGYDRYDRLLAICSRGGEEINRQMVTEGWAVAFGNYGREESLARAGKRGIWASEFQRPADWRAAENH